MNADEWDRCEVPLTMLGCLPSPSDRKLRLFGCACCLAGPNKGEFRAEYLKTLAWADRPSQRSLIQWWVPDGGHRLPELASHWAWMWAYYATDLVPARTQADFLRDLFGNPFRPVRKWNVILDGLKGGQDRGNDFDDRWQTRTVTSLARLAYDGQDFSLLPVLADALEDAGCENAFVLDHCRSQGPHVRGCWLVDLVLDKD
jgi:hypothetical protein